MGRREFITVLGGTVVTWPLAALGQHAQQTEQVYQVGYLSAPTRQSVQHLLEVFLRELRELGWVEGKNISIEYRWAEGNLGSLPDLAANLVQRNVDLIVAPTSPAAIAAKNATGRIPIVTIFPRDPVELGLVTSLSHPGGNVTGTTFTAGPGWSGKLLEFLKQAVPHAINMAIFGNPEDPSVAPQIRELESAADLLSIHLQRFEALTPDQFDNVFAMMAAQHTEAILITTGAFLPYRNKLAELAVKHRLPTISGFREFAEAGSLLSYGVNMADFVGKAAVYVDKILKGAKPADLAMEQPTKFELVINLKAAKSLGIAIRRCCLRLPT
jgi:putative ABC transport system substrate-binding protein